MKVAVIGAGIWGASTALYLQKMGHEVILIEMWGPGNVRSGSGGASRIIRLGYGHDEIYITLTARSFNLWKDILGLTLQEHYLETGLLWLFSTQQAAYALDSIRPMSQLGFMMEEISLSTAVAQYPQISFTGIARVFYEPQAGILAANKCCEQVVTRFKEIGGRYVAGVAHIPDEQSPFIQINNEKLLCDKFVFAAGPWSRKMFDSALGQCTYVSKQEVYHFAVPPGKLALFGPQQLPTWLEYDPDSPLYYGMPMHLGKGFKIAYDDRSTNFDPDIDDRLVNEIQLARARTFVGQRFPDLQGSPISYAEVCQYDNSRDGHFIIDYHPQNPQFLLMCGSSGHGFKMGPALGELVATHLTTGQSLPEIFSLSRFSKISTKQTQFLPNK